MREELIKKVASLIEEELQKEASEFNDDEWLRDMVKMASEDHDARAGAYEAFKGMSWAAGELGKSAKGLIGKLTGKKQPVKSVLKRKPRKEYAVGRGTTVSFG